MLDSLKDYLQTVLSANNQPSQTQAAQIADISSSGSFTNTQLSHEPSAMAKWTHHFSLIGNCV
jgi:hypothetical protein